MVDQLRLLWNQPLDERSRRCLFAAAATLIAGAALVLTLADDSAPDRPRPRHRATSGLMTFPAPAPAVPTATPSVPSEEGPPAGTGTPEDVASSRRVARAFLAGYLPYTYGERSARHFAYASPALRRQLLHNAPRVPAGEPRLHPRVVLVQSDGVGPDRAQLHALVDDGRTRYTVALELARAGHGWTVTRAGD